MGVLHERQADIARLSASELREFADAAVHAGEYALADEAEAELQFRIEWAPKMAALEARFGREPGMTFRQRLERARRMEFFTEYADGDTGVRDATRAAFEQYLRAIAPRRSAASSSLPRGRERRSPACRARRASSTSARRSESPPGEPEPDRRRRCPVEHGRRA